MPTSEEPKSVRAISCVSQLRQWWRRRSELDAIDQCELEWIAADFGMSGLELKELVAGGPHAADQVHERMHLLGLTRANVERLAHGLMRDLERTCARCSKKGTCKKDLATHPEGPSWGGYCLNAATLNAVKIALHHFPTP